MAEEAVDKVGLGVDLLGGPQTLTMLKEIRAEMTAIAALGGRGQSAVSGVSGDLDAREKIHRDSNRRLAADRIAIEKQTSQTELDIRAQAFNKRQDLNRKINQRAEQFRQEEKRAQIAAQQDEANRHRQALEQRRLRVKAYSQLEGIETRDLTGERKAFKRYRTSEARDRLNPNDQTNVYRRQLAEEVQGQRNALRERRRFIAEEEAVNKLADENRRKEMSRARQAEVERRSLDQRVLGRNINTSNLASLPSSIRKDIEIDLDAQRLARRRQTEAQAKIDFDKANAEKKVRMAEQRRQFDADMAIRARQFQIEDQVGRLQGTASTRAAKASAQGQLNSGQADAQVRDFRERQALRQRLIDKYATPPPPPPKGPNVPSRFGGDPNDALNPRGVFGSLDAVGRITRNILLYEVVSRASYGLVTYIGNAIQAAKTTVEFSNALRFATESAGGNVAQNLRLADSLGPIGLSRQQGRAAVTEAVRFAENRPQDTGRLLNIVTNIAAERGGGIDRTDELIEQLRRRESKFYKRIFGKTVESIYQDEAARVVDARTTSSTKTPELFIGEKFKSRSDEIKEYVTALDDAGKEQAVFNYILSQEGKFAGEAAERATTLAGRIDKVNAAFLNGQEGIGLFITDLKFLNDIADTLSKKGGFLNSLEGPALGRTGPNGTISEYDKQKYALESTTGRRASLLNTVNSVGEFATNPTNLLAGAGLLTASFLGRRQALATAQSTAYTKALDTVGTKFNGDLAAATNEAMFKAKNARAGFVSKVGAGINRVTGSLSNAFNSTLGYDNTQFRSGYELAGRGSLSQSYLAAQARGASYGRGAGGVGGAVLGASLGALVAEKITSNQIVATGITILGGVAGAATGSALGEVAGASIGTGILARGGIGSILKGSASGGPAVIGSLLALLTGYGIGSVIEPAISDIGGLPIAQERKRAEAQKRLEKLQYADRLQNKEFERNQQQGLTRYRFASGPLGLQDYGSSKFGIDSGLPYQIETITREQRKQAESTLVGARSAIDSIKQRYGLSSDLFRDPTSSGKFIRNPDATSRVFDPTAVTEELGRKRLALEDEVKSLTIQKDLYVENAELSAQITKDITERQAKITDINSAQERLNELVDTEANIRKYGVFGANDKYVAQRKEYESTQAESISKRLAKDKEEYDKALNRYVSELGNGLSKLRDAAQGSFRIVGDVGTSISGEDNPYTKVLADQITVAERMKQQWGFLGQAAVDYFTKIEQGAIKRQLNKVEFSSYTTASGLLGQADREAAQRSGPGLSRREQDYLDIQAAIVDRALQVPKLWEQAAAVLGRTNDLTPRQAFAGRLNLIARAYGTTGPTLRNAFGQDITPDGTRRNALGQSLGNYFDVPERRNVFGQSLSDPAAVNSFARVGSGESPEVRRALQKGFADTIVESFRDYTPQQIRQSGFQDFYLGALQAQGLNLRSNIEQQQEKALFGAREDERLNKQLEADDRFRQAQLLKGYNPNDVGRESDALLLSRTDNIAPKDLSFTQFRARQEALRRQADRQEQDRQEAQKAVQEGLAKQQEILETLQAIRAGLLGGDMSLLVQVQNDTQARIDQSSLQELATGNYNVPLDQSETKSNPYSDSLGRYGRGGRKR